MPRSITAPWTARAFGPAGHRSPGRTRCGDPGCVVFGDRLYCFLTDANSNRIRYKSMSTAGTWSPWYEIPTGSTNAAPTAVVQGGKIWLFVKGLAGKVLWWCSTSTPETTSSWSPWTSCNGSSEAAPAVAFNPGDNLFHLLVRGNMVPRIWHRTLDPATPRLVRLAPSDEPRPCGAVDRRTHGRPGRLVIERSSGTGPRGRACPSVPFSDPPALPVRISLVALAERHLSDYTKHPAVCNWP